MLLRFQQKFHIVLTSIFVGYAIVFSVLLLCVGFARSSESLKPTDLLYVLNIFLGPWARVGNPLFYSSQDFDLWLVRILLTILLILSGWLIFTRKKDKWWSDLFYYVVLFIWLVTGMGIMFVSY